MNVKSLGHLVLYVRDLERSRRFYADVLGWDEVRGDMPIGGLAAAFSSGRTHHELLLIEVGPDAAPIPAGRRVGMYHFGLKIGDSDDELREAQQRLTEAGVPVVGASDHTITHSLYVEDPDGNEIELYIDVQPEVWRDNPAAVFAPVKPLQLSHPRPRRCVGSRAHRRGVLAPGGRPRPPEEQSPCPRFRVGGMSPGPEGPRRVPRLPHPSLHGHPPLTPAGVLLTWWVTIPLVALAFAFLAVAAAVDDGSVLLTWDEPVTRALMDLRSPGLDGIVKSFSSLGGITVVTLVLLLLLLLVWFECRSLALVLLGASVARPLLEWALKELVDRPRPRFGQLVAGSGASFPSGHVMAAIAVWGLLPPVIAVVSGRRSAWWWSVGISATIIAVVAFSRVYLGVHWLSDVVAALLLGALYLLGVELLLDWHHRRQTCPHLNAGFDAVEAAWRAQER